MLFEFIISQCKQNGRFSEKLKKESHFEVGTEYHGTRQSQDQMKVPSSAKIKGYKFNLIVLYFLRPARHNLDRHSEEQRKNLIELHQWHLCHIGHQVSVFLALTSVVLID